jgi:hypothetical protein
LAEKNPSWKLDDAKRIKNTYFASNRSTDLVRFGFAPDKFEFGEIQDAADEVEYARSLNAAVTTTHIGLGKYNPGVHFIRQFREKNLLGPDLLFSHATTLEPDELDAMK